MKAKEAVSEPPSNSFLRTLGELRKGVAMTEASKDLANVVKEVQRTGRPGEMNLKLKVRPSADGESVSIEDDINAKVPRMAKKATTFFATEEGGLSRENPMQPEMFQIVDGDEQVAPPVQQQTAVNQ